ncbi:MAG: Tm-1-like ATP-binding domain-containing protein [Gammaproteobacteria bacterium]|nr:Tm-1-like ATP-binding domain-containing protein [Gammaproteobacteria bacterium]
MKKIVCLIGSFDTKAQDYLFLREEILKQNCDVFTINTGIFPSSVPFPVDIESEQLAALMNQSIASLREKKDRGVALDIIAKSLKQLLPELHQKKKFDGIIGMGGTGGTGVITTGMRALKLGIPKVCVSTMAVGDISAYIDTQDIVMMPSVTDIAGVNRISKLIYTQAAGMIVGMVNHLPQAELHPKPLIVASMFGNTTPCILACHALLTKKNYEVIEFHMTGIGGKAMEQLIVEGFVTAVLDITTTEWADALCGGILAAYPERLSIPGQYAIPHLIAPGCIDMVNFAGIDTVPECYRQTKRLFYEWSPSATLMRTNEKENEQLGKLFAERANQAKGPVAFLIPLRGFSALGAEGEIFHDPLADRAFIYALKAHLNPLIPLIEMDAHINDPAFSNAAVDLLLTLIEKKHAPHPNLSLRKVTPQS